MNNIIHDLINSFNIITAISQLSLEFLTNICQEMKYFLKISQLTALILLAMEYNNVKEVQNEQAQNKATDSNCGDYVAFVCHFYILLSIKKLYCDAFLFKT